MSATRTISTLVVCAAMALVGPSKAAAQRVTSAPPSIHDAVQATEAILLVRILTPGEPVEFDLAVAIRRESPEPVDIPRLAEVDTTYQVRVLTVLKGSPHAGGVGVTVTIGHSGEATGKGGSFHVPDTNLPVLQAGREYLIFANFKEERQRLQLGHFDTLEMPSGRVVSGEFGPWWNRPSELAGKSLEDAMALIEAAQR